MMNNAHSYEFESFDPIVVEEVEQISEPEITEEDLEKARRAGIQLGVEQGFSSGEQKAREELEKFFRQAAEENDQAVEKLFQQLADQFEIVFSQYNADIDRQVKMMLQVSRAVWSRLFPKYTEQYGDAEIVAVVSECLQMMREERRITIEFASKTEEKMTKLLAPLMKIYQDKFQVTFASVDDLDAGDVRMRWDKGSAERVTQDIVQQVDQIIDQALESYAQHQSERDEPQEQST